MRMLPDVRLSLWPRQEMFAPLASLAHEVPYVIAAATDIQSPTRATMKRGSVRCGSRVTLALPLPPILLRAGRSLFGVETAVQPPVDGSSTGTDRSPYKLGKTQYL